MNTYTIRLALPFAPTASLSRFLFASSSSPPLASSSTLSNTFCLGRPAIKASSTITNSTRNNRILVPYQGTRTMSSAAKSPLPIPIICCGQREEVAVKMIEAFKPEVEVVYFAKLSPSTGKLVSHVLKGQEPPPDPESSSVGTGNFSPSRPPLAVMLGGAFTAESIKPLRATADALEGTRKVPWVIRDNEKPGAASPGTEGFDPAEYVRDVGQRVRETMVRINEEGKLDGEFDEVVGY